MKPTEKEVRNSCLKKEIRAGQWAGWLALGVIALGIGAFVSVKFGLGGDSWLPGCMFRELTGLHCPGCGMTRAVQAVVHGEMAKAFRFNPLGMILLPLVGVGICMEMLGWARGRPLPFRSVRGVWGVWTVAGVVALFWILRNLPGWPFSLLAPP